MSIFDVHIHDALNIYYLRVALSSLKTHQKTSHGFKDTPDDTHRCGNGVKTLEQFQFDCHLFHTQRECLPAVLYPLETNIYPNFTTANPELTNLTQ